MDDGRLTVMGMGDVDGVTWRRKGGGMEMLIGWRW